MFGIPADITAINEIAKRHNLFVIEDACQAHLAEVNGVKCGAIGDAGCFSFQTSKNLPLGEGGAVTSNDEEFMNRCQAYHNYGFSGTPVPGLRSGEAAFLGTKLLLAEYQAAIGLVGLQYVEALTDLRWANGRYLRERLANIPGIVPAKLYGDTTKAAFHFFPFMFKSSEFNGMSRALFSRALRAEGINHMTGYGALHGQPYIKHAFESKNFRRMYTASELDYESYKANNQCPVCDNVHNNEAIWMSQSMLLGSRADMDAIVNAERIINEAV
jgi:dTDP-4-amino-4,6-dideoxygalactose transaminase